MFICLSAIKNWEKLTYNRYTLSYFQSNGIILSFIMFVIGYLQFVLVLEFVLVEVSLRDGLHLTDINFLKSDDCCGILEDIITTL